MGKLIISGTLDAKQFWPGGRSDADTATVVVDKNSFVFVNNAGKRQTTHAFQNAEVVGQHGRNPVIKVSKKTSIGHVTIRLQGIDAPELHYQPQVTGAGGKGIAHPFRQSLGETCANALHGLVASLGQAEIPCEVQTIVDKPSDVCDVFGRVVGNILIAMGGHHIDINQWLLREGWALPALYNSMEKIEIQAVLNDHHTAQTGKRGLFSHNIVTGTLAPFDHTRVEEKGPADFQPFSDTGPVNFPKFFRRDAERYVVGAIGGNAGADLRAFIAMKPTDLALELNKFLKLKGSVVGKKPRPEFKQLATFLAHGFPLGPELVFWENDSKLVKAGTNTEIKTWG
jgi:endonuclease YncB( thermonuclease family)